jgi:glycosyltransferase involved in cell wall biosynthesis
MIPEIITNGVNGFISNDENELRSYLDMLTSDEDLATKLGQQARLTIEKEYGLDTFVSNWTNVLREAAEINACP